jgi:hypothetical protein
LWADNALAELLPVADKARINLELGPLATVPGDGIAGRVESLAVRGRR